MSEYSPAERLRYKLDSRMKKAIRDYALIEEGDSLLIALSGGKDSLSLVALLGDLATHFRPSFRVSAVHVRMKNIPYQADCAYLEAYCARHKVPFWVRETSFDPETDHRKSPCFLCSWNRRKTLFETAGELGCNKLVFGHHRDDFLETLLLNMLFQGSIQAMAPMLQMDRFPMRIIRPLCLISEEDLAAFAVQEAFQPQQKRCPYEKSSFRPSVREMLEKFEAEHPGAKDSLWASMSHIYPQYLPPRDINR